MGPSRAHGPSAGPAEANGLPETHGPPKVHRLRGHCTPLPPFSVTLVHLQGQIVRENQTISATNIAQNAASHSNLRNSEVSSKHNRRPVCFKILQRLLRIPNAL